MNPARALEKLRRVVTIGSATLTRPDSAPGGLPRKRRRTHVILLLNEARRPDICQIARARLMARICRRTRGGRRATVSFLILGLDSSTLPPAPSKMQSMRGHPTVTRSPADRLLAHKQHCTKLAASPGPFSRARALPMREADCSMAEYSSTGFSELRVVRP